LETLCQGGFVIRDEMDDRYRPTLAVTNLAEGAQNEAWIREGAWPLIAKLGKQILWPIGIWTLTDSDLILRAATDRTSPLALNRLTSGAHADLFESGAGQVVQAFETSQKRNLLEEIGLHRHGQTSLKGQLEAIRTRGYAFDVKAVGGEINLAVPVLRPSSSEGPEVLAAVTVRFIRSALSDDRAIGELLPKLLHLATDIRQAYLEFAPPASQGSRANAGGRSPEYQQA
jgi:IclR family mhp operon transcriptional activator